MCRKFSQICPKYILFLLIFLGVVAILFYVKLRYIQHDADINKKIPCNVSFITSLFNNDSYASCLFSKLVARKATGADPELMQLIRYMLDPPSKSRPQIQGTPPKTPQHNEINSILNNQVSCFANHFWKYMWNWRLTSCGLLSLCISVNISRQSFVILRPLTPKL